MSNEFRVGLTRDCLGRDGRNPVFDPAAFAVLRVEKSLVFEYIAESGDEVTPKPVPRTSASSRTSSLVLLCFAAATCFASAPASLNESKKLLSLNDTSSPAPRTPL